MNFRLVAAALFALAISVPASAQTPDLAAIARSSGTPDIPGLKMVWLSPWGDLAKSHPWRNIIVHQTEGPAGSARGGAQEQFKNPTRRGVMVWVAMGSFLLWLLTDGRWPVQFAHFAVSRLSVHRHRPSRAAAKGQEREMTAAYADLESPWARGQVGGSLLDDFCCAKQRGRRHRHAEFTGRLLVHYEIER